MANELNVKDMLDEYASENGVDAADIFKKPDPQPVEKKRPEPKKEEPGEWRPDASLMEGMDEFKSSGVTYDKKDVIFQREIVNGADEQLKEESRENMDDLQLKTANIEEAKKRHGISKLQIPPGELQVRFLIAASDRNHEVAQAKLDELLHEVETTYPNMILERIPGTEPVVSVTQKTAAEVAATAEEKKKEEPAAQTSSIEGIDTPPVNEDEVKVVIDKRNLSKIVWSPEEVEKIKKSRTLELNIVEGADIELGSVEDVDSNAVDAVLATYQRKTNDIASPLPASKYRACFRGLTYPEVIDLTSANRINNLDGERLKWTLVYNHMYNVSIGPWQEYILYKDPNTKKEVRCEVGDVIPAAVPNEDIHQVTKFEDFLRHTSYIDLEFCLWKLLCATSMEKEVVSIDCHTKLENGQMCNNKYDWIYAPNELLAIDSVDPAVLQEMEETTNATSVEEAIKIYNTSPVAANNYVDLHTTGFKILYGHISAYEYLEGIYPKIKEIEDAEEKTPEMIAKSLAFEILTVVKAVLIPKPNGGYQRIRGIDNLQKVIAQLDEIDYETLEQIKDLMTKPYQFAFSMRDIVCPKCKNRSMIPINDMASLLFIIARSLSSVEVTLKRI